MYKIEFTEEVLLDIEEIERYVWDFHKVKVLTSIYQTINLLESNPEMWKIVEYWDREIINLKYRYQIRYELIWKIASIIMIYKFQNR